MIKLMKKGDYQLVQTKNEVKILYLDKKAYAWVFAKDIGEILVTSHTPHKVDHVLAVGRFRLYEVEAEPHLTDLPHLELLVGDRRWQGYLLLTGLPTDQKTRSRIIPTNECITAPSKGIVEP
jgi:hypothetical protein